MPYDALRERPSSRRKIEIRYCVRSSENGKIVSDQHEGLCRRQEPQQTTRNDMGITVKDGDLCKRCGAKLGAHTTLHGSPGTRQHSEHNYVAVRGLRLERRAVGCASVSAPPAAKARVVQQSVLDHVRLGSGMTQVERVYPEKTLRELTSIGALLGAMVGRWDK